MLQVTEPRPGLAREGAADPRGARWAVSGPKPPPAAMMDEWLDEEPPVRAWSRAEAADLARRQPSLSPWRVVVWQVAVAAVAALVAQLVSGDIAVTLSALYGGLVVALPGALMARAATRSVAGVLPGLGAVSLLAFSAAKLAATLFLLALAPRVIPGLHWPALLATLAIGLQTYWVALAIRPRSTAHAPSV